MLIVAVTGMPGSGKSVVAGVVSRVLNLPVYSMGDIVREEVRRRGLPLTSSNIELIARKLREERGDAAVAEILAVRITSESPKGAIVDGMRSLAEARVFAGMGRLCIVAVHASPRTRYQRILARSRKGDAVSWGEFVERDLNNIRLGIGEVIALADYMIVNESTLRELELQALRIGRLIADGEGKDCSGGRY
jgi:dephospho-CoA kinase